MRRKDQTEAVAATANELLLWMKNNGQTSGKSRPMIEGFCRDTGRDGDQFPYVWMAWELLQKAQRLKWNGSGRVWKVLDFTPISLDDNRDLISEEYKGKRPGCYKCKQPISEEDDYYRLTWVGKTWEVTMDYHIDCLIEAVKEGEIGKVSV
jgi:hypothetical protein